MHNDTRQITGHYFGKDSLTSLPVEEIRDFISRYPYAAPARYLLARKIYDESPSDAHDDLITAGLYIHNPLWLHSLLTNEQLSPGEETGPSLEPQEPEAVTETEVSTTEPATVHEKAASTSQEPIAFQSYHTIDYFASQGIRLQQAELARDKLGQQLKSFTEWLRSMKKLPSSESDAVQQGPEDVIRRERVILSAANSIEEKDVYTEAMAEVWAKQGNHAKAIDVYNKLSLQNPAKSAYFAAKIDLLK